MADDGTGIITMEGGRSTLTPANGAIGIAASADGAETLARLEDVIARHLIRFGADGELEVAWVSSREA